MKLLNLSTSQAFTIRLYLIIQTALIVDPIIAQSLKVNSQTVTTLPSDWPTLFIYNPEREQNTSPAKTAVFIEFGDGGFTFEFLPMREFQGPIGPKRILATATAIYDTIQRPPRKVVYAATSTSTDYRGVNQVPILLEGNVKITPSLRSIFPGDELIYVITYKNCSRFTFRYDTRVFNAITIESQVEYGNEMVESIRKHKKEEVVSTPISGNNGLVNVTTHELDSDRSAEKNIFISLVAKDSSAIPTSLGGQTVVGVVAYNKAGGEIGRHSFTQTIGMAHDPNWIKSRFLSCFHWRSSEPQITEKKISYVLHFENTGQGAVYDCVAELVLPNNILIGHVIIDSIKIGKNNQNFDYIIPSAEGYLVKSGKINNAFPATITYSTLPHRIKLTFKKNPTALYILSGAPRKEDRSKSHVGEVYFSIKTQSIKPPYHYTRNDGDVIEGYRYVPVSAMINFNGLGFLSTREHWLTTNCPGTRIVPR